VFAKGVVPVEEIEQLKQDFSCKVIELRVPRLDEQRHLLLLQRITALMQVWLSCIHKIR
jgi:hypothetical protein